MNDEQYYQISEALKKINDSTLETNNSISDLRDYFEQKDKQEAEEKETSIKENEEKEAVETEQQEQTEQTYSEQLQNINSQLEATNGMIAGMYVTHGILCGVLLLTILWNKLN